MKSFKEIIKAVKDLKNDENKLKNGKLPSECYFLNEDDAVCFPRKFGDGRRPYFCDGLTLWAYSSGNIKIEESTFNANLDFGYGQEPKIAFYFGEKTENGFIPVSITGAGKSALENGVSRYCAFTDDGAYYIAQGKTLTGGVKASVDKNKNIRFDLYLENTGDKAITAYLSAYFDLVLSHKLFEDIETKWYRLCETTNDGYLVSVTEYLDRTTCLNHYAHIVRTGGEKVYSTTSPTAFKGGQMVSLSSAESLCTGKIAREIKRTIFAEPAVSADVLPVVLSGGESVQVSYTIKLASDKDSALAATDRIAPEQRVFKDIPLAEFEGGDFAFSDFAFGAFFKSVMKQTEFCARAKNYAGPLIGVRDIFQQLEAALLWIPEYCRKKIVEAANFVGDDGRCPRQYSYPDNSEVLPVMDLREFIDQGVWVISTVYRYIAFTGDYSILNEECGYYKFTGNKVEFSARRDSLLTHLIAICDYLVANLDEETDCLHALYGDWNDALDGLGKTNKAGKAFGTGVSVMATMQLYENLTELTEILKRIGGYKAKIEEYKRLSDRVADGVRKYAVAEKDGEMRVLHGWGDDRAYTVGGFCDNDGLSRDSVTANAFFVLSGLIEKFPELKPHILAAYKRLDSKYGIKTFEPYFAPDNKEVGRITRLPKGTAENGATYIHATLFAIWSLFETGEEEAAYEQIGKILPLTHEFISTTPFVMPNSYIYNEELGLDGESMSDWFTGSGCVLVKVFFFCVFGVKADLDGLKIAPPEKLPFEKMRTLLKIKGGEIEIIYAEKGGGRRFFVNGREEEKVCLLNADICGKKIKIEITD